MNLLWSMSAGSVRKPAEGEEKTLISRRCENQFSTKCTQKNSYLLFPKCSTHIEAYVSCPSSAVNKRYPCLLWTLLPGIFASCRIYSGIEAEAARSLHTAILLLCSSVVWSSIHTARAVSGCRIQVYGVYIPGNYPNGDCPRLPFDIPVFDLLVDPTSGELDVRRAFAKWRQNHNHIWQVLMYARRVFYKINTTSPLNPEAAVLYEKDIQLFKSKVVDSVKVCTARLFDQLKIEDPYAISFSPWNPSVHDEAREKMLTQKKPDEQHNKSVHVAGLSWVNPGSVQPFSKEEKTVAT